jgi:hypothetical protein
MRSYLLFNRELVKHRPLRPQVGYHEGVSTSVRDATFVFRVETDGRIRTK